MPQERRSNILIPLFIKGDKTNPKNSREIIEQNTKLKLSTVVTNKLNKSITIEEEPQGFSADRSCTKIFLIRQFQEKSIKQSHVCFVDLKKEFDRVKLTIVISLLYTRDVPLKK